MESETDVNRHEPVLPGGNEIAGVERLGGRAAMTMAVAVAALAAGALFR